MKTLLEDVTNMWNMIDPCHVCPIDNNIVDEYTHVINLSVNMLQNNVPIQVMVDESLISLFDDIEIAKQFIDIKHVYKEFERVKSEVIGT